MRRRLIALKAWAEARHAANVAKANPWLPGHSCHTTKGATMAQDERAGVASETEGEKGTELRPCDSNALTDLLAQMPGTRLLIDAELAPKDAEIKQLTRINEVIMATSDDERAAASKALRDAAHKVAALTQELADIRIRLAERDAQVVALTKRLSEGRG